MAAAASAREDIAPEERRRSALTRTLITEDDQQAIATDNLAKISRHSGATRGAAVALFSLPLNWGSQLAVGSKNQFGFRIVVLLSMATTLAKGKQMIRLRYIQ